jgi:molecular chaperone DnaK
MINEIDKALKEQGDKISPDQKKQAESLRDELKKALDANDMATLESRMNELEQMAQQMASYQYQNAGNAGANTNAGNAGASNNSNNNDDDVVDADYTEKN